MSLRDIHCSSAFEMEVHDLGRMAYTPAFVLQRRLQQEVIASRSAEDQLPGAAAAPSRMHLLLVEHDPPVITVSRRQSARAHLVAQPAQLAEAGIEVAETDRGGDITYHGPGQLVAYPILDLNVLGLRLHSYMRMLEAIVIETLATFNIEGVRDADATGVWVEKRRQAEALGTRHLALGSDPLLPSAPCPVPAEVETADHAAKKICAMGVRISRWVSMHGLALNVTTNLEHFQLIVPCGLIGRTVTSMERELGCACPTMEEVKRELIDVFQRTCRQRIDAHRAVSTREPINTSPHSA